MARLNAAQIAHVALSSGFTGDDAVLMVAIALGESGGDTDATGDVALQNATFGPSLGLWQIRSIKAQSGTGKERDATRLKDPFFNGQSARSIKNSQGLRAWSVFSSGAYRKFLSAARLGVAQPDKNVAGGGGAPTPGGSNAPNLALLDVNTSGIAGVASFFTNTKVWLRAGLFLLGAVLGFVAVWQATGAGNAVMTVAKGAISARTGGLVKL